MNNGPNSFDNLAACLSLYCNILNHTIVGSTIVKSFIMIGSY